MQSAHPPSLRTISFHTVIAATLKGGCQVTPANSKRARQPMGGTPPAPYPRCCWDCQRWLPPIPATVSGDDKGCVTERALS